MVNDNIIFSPDDEITKQTIEFTQFMQKRGYTIYPDFFEKFFPVMAATHLTFEDAEPAIRPIIVKNQTEEASFPFDFQDFITNHKDHAAKKQAKQYARNADSLASNEEALSETEQKIASGTKKIESLKQKLEASPTEPKDLKYLAGKRKKADSEIRRVCGECGLENLEEELQSGNTDPAELKEKLRRAAAASISSPQYKELMDYFKRAYKSADKMDQAANGTIRDEISRQQSALDDLQEKADKLKQQQEALRDALSSVNDRLLKKLEASEHRSGFQPGSAVQTMHASDNMPELDQEFAFLSAAQKAQIRDYIRENTRVFRTRLLRNVNTNAKRKLDIPETCKKACATNGIPLRLCYKKPVRSKAKLLMFLDISGSCREASELMLYFMYTMKEIFPAGCKCYVFVNHLFDISEFFDTPDPEEAIQEVMKHVPTRGVYSDYGVPFREFYDLHQAEVTKDSIVFFIGDARNNKNDPGEAFIKYISRKCRSAYWFNTEPVDKWDTGDSIIRKYKPYMDRVSQTTTTNELIGSLMQVR